MRDIKKILVPVDESAAATQALEEAYGLAHRFNATIEVLHTWHMPITPQAVPHGMLPVAHASDFEDAARRHMAALLDERIPPPGVAVTPILERGVPTESILEHAEDADLIVMATSGRSGLERLLLGSTTEEVVRRAPCPVLTIRAEAATVSHA